MAATAYKSHGNNELKVAQMISGFTGILKGCGIVMYMKKKKILY